MAFCGKCGSSIPDGAAFCPQCGAPAGVSAVGTTTTLPAGTSGLRENVAGTLCYLLGWLTGIIFLLIDKRPLVRFHAAQSIVVFGVLFLLRLALTFGIMGTGVFGLLALWSLVSLLLSIVTLVAWIVLMVMAYQGKRVEVPVAAGIARSIAGNSSI